MHIGNETFKGGRMGEKRSMGLTQALKNKGFEMGRLKTGTPPRAHKQTINFSILEKAEGEKEAMPFSMFTSRPYVPKNIPCYLAYTTKKTHKIIKMITKIVHKTPFQSQRFSTRFEHRISW